MNKVIVIIDIPRIYYKKAKYIFHFFSNAWGIPIKILKNKKLIAKADIVYTGKIKEARWNPLIIIPFDEALYLHETKCQILSINALYLWASELEKINIDIIASTYRLIGVRDLFLYITASYKV